MIHDEVQGLARLHQRALGVARALKIGRPHASPLLSVLENRERLLEFASDELFPAFRHEEEEVFPLIQTTDSLDRTGSVTLQMEHELMRKLIEEIRSAKESELEELLSDFGSLLELHVLEEKQQLERITREALFLPQAASL